MVILQRLRRLLGWPLIAISTLVSIGSRVLDYYDAKELGIPYDVWFIIGLTLFFIAVISLLLQHTRRTSGVESPHPGGKEAIESSWLEQVLDYDKNHLSGLIYWEVDEWSFEHLNTKEPYIEVLIKLTNASVFSIIIEDKISSSFSIENNMCQFPAELHGRPTDIKHGLHGQIRIKQAVSPETRDLMLGKHKKGEKVEIVFGFGLDIETKELPIKINKSVGNRYYVDITLK